MKKFTTYILKLSVASGVGIVVYYFANVNDLYSVLDAKIIPVIVGVVGGISTIFSFFKPLINKLELSDTNLEKMLLITQEAILDNQKLKTELIKADKNVEELSKQVNNLTSMVKIGFANNENLVKKGIANKICKIGEKNEI